MGWFLRRNKSKGRSTRRKGRSAGGDPKPWDPQRMLIAMRILGIAAALVGSAIAWHYGEQWLRLYATQRHAATVHPDDVVLEGVPGWMRELTRQELRERIAPVVTADPLDGRSLSDAADVFGQSPWVRQVRQVQRLADGKLIVQATYRVPMAVVRANDGYHLIDSEGVRLPDIYELHQLADLDLPMLTAVQAAPPRAGELWTGRDVQAGLDLLALLANEPYARQIMAVDLGQRDARDRLRLVVHTTLGVTFHWGFPPGEERAIEPTAQAKRDMVRQVLARYMTADAAHQTRSGDMAGSASNVIIEVYGRAPRSRTASPTGHAQLNLYTSH